MPKELRAGDANGTPSPLQVPNVYAFPPPRKPGVPLYVGQMTRTELRDTIALGMFLGWMLIGMLSGLVMIAMAIMR